MTVSWCKFYYAPVAKGVVNHEFVNLIASSDSDNPNGTLYHVTFHHNWYGEYCRERMPSVRLGACVCSTTTTIASTTTTACARGSIPKCSSRTTISSGVQNPWERFITTGSPGLLKATGNITNNCTFVSGWVRRGRHPRQRPARVGTEPAAVCLHADAGIRMCRITSRPTRGMASIPTCHESFAVGESCCWWRWRTGARPRIGSRHMAVTRARAMSSNAPFATPQGGDSVARARRHDLTSAAETIRSTPASVPAAARWARRNPIKFWAYPGELPVFDFDTMPESSDKAPDLRRNYWHVKGIEIKNAPDSGILSAGWASSSRVASSTIATMTASSSAVPPCAGRMRSSSTDSYRNYQVGSSVIMAMVSPPRSATVRVTSFAVVVRDNADDGWDFTTTPTA